MSEPESGNGPAPYRICPICQEPGADALTHLLVTESGGAYPRYTHPGCAAAVGAPQVGVSR
ncbi:hypothetical protein [Streptomyces sp. TLI_146]|uniref:hypothetical protein n=1 Tax=Streptomyces sp. TLI_146 TaxID=1938858 RepID=UPI000C6FDDBD|nr:hypothetical protein [Streptomyces sp. TLI_146]PKV85863.1 hypothetical protein BX283_3410 [Streptomyces sp. TLI_146]